MPSQFGHALERNFPPAAADRGRFQGVDEITRFLLQPLLSFCQ